MLNIPIQKKKLIMKIILKIIFSSLLIISSSCSNNITYISGSVSNGFIEGSIKDAKFDRPRNLSIDEKTGDLYIIDQNSRVIRKISSQGKVSTVFDISKNKDIDKDPFKTIITSIKIKNDYLYFSTNLIIGRIKLGEIDKYEKYIGTGKEKVIKNEDYFQEITSNKEYSFDNIDFYEIVDFCFDDKDNLIIYDDSKVKIADIKNKTISSIFLGKSINSNISSGYLIKDNSLVKIKFNRFNNQIYFICKFYIYSRELYKIDPILGVVLLKELDKYGYIHTFDIDDEGNIYFVSWNKGSIVKLDNKGIFTDIEKLSNIPLDLSYSLSTGDFNKRFTDITIDNKNKILYFISSNRIFKIKL